MYFYVQGASSALELVVNKLGKDTIAGYVSTPKGFFAGVLFVVLIPGNRTHAEIGRTASVDVDKSKQRRSGRELTSFDQLLFVRTVQKGSARLPTALEFRPCLVARIGFVGVDVLDIIRRLV